MFDGFIVVAIPSSHVETADVADAHCAVKSNRTQIQIFIGYRQFNLNESPRPARPVSQVSLHSRLVRIDVAIVIECINTRNTNYVKLFSSMPTTPNGHRHSRK